MSSQLHPLHQESTLTLSISGRREPVPVRDALDPSEGSHYDDLLTALRGMTIAERENSSKALLLIEIEDLARNELKEIGKAIDRSVKSWNLDPYHHKVLLDPGHTANTTNTPDSFFRRHARTKPRVILRLTSKVVLQKVRSLLSSPPLLLKVVAIFDTLDLHSQINGFIERWDKNIEQASRQGTPQKGGQGKRQRENTIDERASKRRLKTEPVDQESLRQSQTLSTGHPSSTEDIPRQVDSINRARALPTITSLQPGLSSVQPHKNLPSPASTQITTQTAHLTEHNVLRASPVGPAPQPSCHQAQQSSTLQTEEEQRPWEPQVQQQQEELQHRLQQQQDFIDEDMENEWDVEDFTTYLLFQ
ncbi:hypothetical protein IFR04_000993 [Cadophora malorum]|uniref:Uncharacterized protein n=1 Tax=Cadophora malorum TaxID=108018 RepID=A0A8H7WJ01_9HELO|nr:hypothetical protein IFR04_000993 [Cadophora malorum]